MPDWPARITRGRDEGMAWIVQLPPLDTTWEKGVDPFMHWDIYI